MPATDLPLLIDAIRIAGRIATSFTGPSAKRWEKEDGAGPVTEADLAVDRYLSTTLQRARPGYGWLSEETEDSETRLGRSRVFIVDPIDGTRSFVEGARTWAISVAVAEAGEITAGAVYLPVRDKLFAAAKGQGATLNGLPLTVSDIATLPEARILAAKPNFDPKFWPGGAPDVKRHYRPSLAYRLSLIGAGSFDAMFMFRDAWEWDIAAGSLIVTEGGGRITDRRGLPLRFNNAHPVLDGIVAGSAPLHETLMDKLRG